MLYKGRTLNFHRRENNGHNIVLWTRWRPFYGVNFMYTHNVVPVLTVFTFFYVTLYTRFRGIACGQHWHHTKKCRKNNSSWPTFFHIYNLIFLLLLRRILDYHYNMDKSVCVCFDIADAENYKLSTFRLHICRTCNQIIMCSNSSRPITCNKYVC